MKKMKKMKQMLQIIAFAILSVGSLDAKGGSSGGGSRSSGGFSSSSRSSSSASKPSAPASKPSSGWSSSSNTAKSAPVSKPTTTTSTTPPKQTWGTTPQTSTRPVSAVEKSRYEASVKAGKTFQTRDAAVADFKTKEAPKYTSRYTAEPSTRPQHIPQSYNNQTIVYNQQGGGYGYWGGGGPGLGTFMLYDIIQDEVNMQRMMSNSNYHIGPPHSNGWGSFWWCLTIVIIVAGTITVFCLMLRD